ncbi:MAG: hypothetical protein RL213_971 [Bacteroidota bacterium]|jgi:uncharacterized protein (DUF1501 family)
MKRRTFLEQVAAATVLPSLINGFSFRTFAQSPLMNALAASTVDDHVLVLIQLNGGNDGLNTVIPLDQYGNLSAARSNILIPSNQVLPLTGTNLTGFHPAMNGMRQLYDSGNLSVIQGVSYPSPNFSHFRATDIWLSGSDSNQVLSSGWAGRYLNYEYPNYPTGYPNAAMPDPLAIQIGTSLSLALQGPSAGMGMTIGDPNQFYNLVSGIQDPAPNNRYGTELTYIRTVTQQSQAYSSVIVQAALNVSQQSSSYPAAGTNLLADQLKIVARLIAGGLKTRIYLVSLGGFDTHSLQADTNNTAIGTHATLLGKVSDAIAAFMDDLAFLSISDRVIGMTFSEFGRRIKSNASAGTDHGSGAPMFVFGTQVQPGLIGSNPLIPANATVNDNVPMQYDFRSVYASILNQWLCVPANDLQQILLQNYQTLPIVDPAACSVGIDEFSDAAGDNLVFCYPNPFVSRTTVKYVSKGGHVLVQVFNPEGQLIRTLVDRELAPGSYEVDYENEGHAAGIYHLRLQNESIQQVKSMVVVRG